MGVAFPVAHVAVEWLKLRTTAVQPKVRSASFGPEADDLIFFLHEHRIAKRGKNGEVELPHVLEMLLTSGKGDVRDGHDGVCKLLLGDRTVMISMREICWNGRSRGQAELAVRGTRLATNGCATSANSSSQCGFTTNANAAHRAENWRCD
jgi:hypothetical protein